MGAGGMSYLCKTSRRDKGYLLACVARHKQQRILANQPMSHLLVRGLPIVGFRLSFFGRQATGPFDWPRHGSRRLTNDTK